MSRTVDETVGSGARPLTPADRIGKFQDCWAFAGGKGSAEKALALAGRLASPQPIRATLASLAAELDGSIAGVKAA